MKKYSVQLASLVLFFAIFAPGIAIGMEKEIPSLPPDVRKIIANKTLRVILDEAEEIHSSKFWSETILNTAAKRGLVRRSCQAIWC